jgi:integrase/recombinase XerC
MHLSSYHTHVEEYLSYIAHIKNYSPQTVTTYRITLSQLAALYDVVKGEFNIKTYRLNIAREHRKTISKKLSAIRSFIKFLNTYKNYTLELIGDAPIKVPQTLPKPIHRNYIDEVLESSTLQEKTLILLMYGVGLRISEVASIKLENISKEWLLVEGKGAKERQLPLLQSISETIQAYIAFSTPKSYLFEKNAKAMSVDQIRYRLTKPFRAKGIKATPHQLRHSFATELLNNDARISDISKLLGHKTMDSTQIYTKLANSKKLQDYMASHPLCQTKESE